VTKGSNPTASEVLSEIKGVLVEFVSRPEIDTPSNSLELILRPIARVAIPIFTGLAALAEVQNWPRSPGYQPLLCQHGFDPISARITANIVVRHGYQIAIDQRDLPAAFEAIRFLAKPGRKRHAVRRRVEFLLVACDQTSVLESIRQAGYTGFDFVDLLKLAAKLAANEDETAVARLAEAAASIAPHLPNLRGPKIGAASAAHEFFYQAEIVPGEPRAYTWNVMEADFTDPMTVATRREFNDPDFNPVPAHRRLKAKLNQKSGDGADKKTKKQRSLEASRRFSKSSN
jgi:hypothetical protein